MKTRKFIVSNRVDCKYQLSKIENGELVRLAVGDWDSICDQLEYEASERGLLVTYTGENGTCAFAA